jgi:hypothetical protein
MNKNLLLEENWTETAVEGTDTLVLQDLGHPADEAIGKARLRHKADTGGLEWAQSDISEEFCSGSGGEVDGGTVVGCGLDADFVDELLLEELITTELECTLQEITCKGWANTGPDGAGTLLGDDLLETTDQTSVVCEGIELYSCLDAAR